MRATAKLMALSSDVRVNDGAGAVKKFVNNLLCFLKVRRNVSSLSDLIKLVIGAYSVKV